MENIVFQDFIEAVEQLSSDVKLEPYLTSKEALLQFMEKKDNFITLKELK